MVPRFLKTKAVVILIPAVISIAVSIAVVTVLAGPGGVPGKPPKAGEDVAGNNLSFPVLFAEEALPSVPALGQFEPGDAVLGSDDFLLVDDTRVYLQKDPLNIWLAYWEANPTEPVILPVDSIDVGDNLESVPWRTTSVVRVEFVPFQYVNPDGLETFDMYYVSGQGPSEVWGATASNTDPPIANVYLQPYATLYSNTMALSVTKLEAGDGDVNVDPDPEGDAYVWDPIDLVWRTNTEPPLDVAQNRTTPFTAEINVKGRLIYGYNWFLKREAMSPTISKQGWWRLTFHSLDPAPPLDFYPGTGIVDPTAAAPLEAEPGGTYPRVPVVDVVNDLTYIDIYIEASNAGGKGQGKGGNGGNGGNSGKGKKS